MKERIIRGLKKLTWGINDGLFLSGLKTLNPSRFGRRILLYHGITKYARTDINARFIDLELFEKQIHYFKLHFNVVALEEYFQGANHPDKLTIAITFDDGYMNNFTDALPILEKYKVPATFNITAVGEVNYNVLWADMIDLFRVTGPNRFTFQNTKYKKGRHEYYGPNGTLKQCLKHSDWETKKELVDTILDRNDFMYKPEYFPYFKLMNSEQIKQLSVSNYARIGSHGLYHNCLDKITHGDAKTELSKSKNYLENIIQKEVISIAYPDGRYTPDILDFAEELGYKIQLAVDYLYEADESDLRLENRFGINPYISFNNQIQCILDGRY